MLPMFTVFEKGDLVQCMVTYAIKNAQTGEEYAEFYGSNGEPVSLPIMGNYYIVRELRDVAKMTGLFGMHTIVWSQDMLLEEIHNPPADSGREISFPANHFIKVDTMAPDSVNWTK